MLKTKERVKKIIERLCDFEAQYEAADEDEKRLENLLKDDK